MKRLFIVSIAFMAMLILNSSVLADIKTDRDVGVCMTYLILLKKPSDVVRIALRQADDQVRAEQFLQTEFTAVERLHAQGKWDQSNQSAFAFKGEAAWRKIGIRPGDY